MSNNRPTPVLTETETELATRLTAMYMCGDGFAELTSASPLAKSLVFALRNPDNLGILADGLANIETQEALATSIGDLDKAREAGDDETPMVILFELGDSDDTSAEDDTALRMNRHIWARTAEHHLLPAGCPNASHDLDGGPNGQCIIRGRRLNLDMVNGALDKAAKELYGMDAGYIQATQIITDAEGNSAVWHL